MNSRKIAALQIGVALFFAATILLASYLGGSDTITYLIIAVWFIPFSWLASKEQKQRSNKHCLKPVSINEKVE
ncbi:MAG: hypothetical protein D8M58_12485 [Calditrichaeota bacterium]|nr:MAG: hypothetical protein DWQ03_13270 [Calditrichota bacterium]MBL1206214.1 hypothetical protein [Calditrichota bacterium]NOG46039.1 hypothetical protein [Calditrichota bacterium]